MNDVAPFEFTPNIFGETISLRQLKPEDFEELYAAASDPLIWEQHPFPLRYQREVFESGFFLGALASDGALVITDRASNKIIGSSRFYDWDFEKCEVAIGFSFLARCHWGGGANQELKRLMLGHAFRWANVVWFHVGVKNVRSRKAMEKIGGKFSHIEVKEIHGVMHDHAFYRIDAPNRNIP